MVKHQHGGKLIDSGTYGCINYPALPCWSKQKQTSRQYHDKTFVSKIMTTDEAEYEIKNIKEIKKLDYLDVFTLRNIQICKANEFSEKTDNLSKCNVIYHDDVIDKSCKGKKLFYDPAAVTSYYKELISTGCSRKDAVIDCTKTFSFPSNDACSQYLRRQKLKNIPTIREKFTSLL